MLSFSFTWLKQEKSIKWEMPLLTLELGNQFEYPSFIYPSLTLAILLQYSCLRKTIFRKLNNFIGKRAKSFWRIGIFKSKRIFQIFNKYRVEKWRIYTVISVTWKYRVDVSIDISGKVYRVGPKFFRKSV